VVPPRRLAAVVLAAGRGTRFPGVPSKVLVELHGRPLVRHVLDALAPLAPERVIVVVGHGKDAVRAALATSGVETVEQGEQRGTGHALLAAAPVLGGEAHDLLVLSGDVPGLRTATLQALLDGLRRTGAAALATATVADPARYGRVLRREDGSVAAIVEAADASAEELRVPTINVGAYAFRAPEIFEILAEVGDDNRQGEVYLTDAVARLVGRGLRVEPVELEDPREGMGVNTREELEAMERDGNVGRTER